MVPRANVFGDVRNLSSSTKFHFPSTFNKAFEYAKPGPDAIFRPIISYLRINSYIHADIYRVLAFVTLCVALQFIFCRCFFLWYSFQHQTYEKTKFIEHHLISHTIKNNMKSSLFLFNIKYANFFSNIFKVFGIYSCFP